MKNDQYYLNEAINVGKQAAQPRNLGAVIVKDGEVIARGHNEVHELHDPTAHAELSAIRAAAARLGEHNLEGCVLYGSHEPCLMCFSCAAWAKIERLVYATAASDQGNSYEFDNLSLQDLAKKLKRPMSVEQVSV